MEPIPPFIHYQYQLDLLDIPMLFFFRIIVDVFNLCCFIYIISKRQIAKAALYATLNTFFVIIVNILKGNYPNWIYPYVILVYIGYTLLAYDRTVIWNKRNEENIQIKFIQKMEDDYEVVKSDDFDIDTNATNEDLDQTSRGEKARRDRLFHNKFLSMTHQGKRLKLPQNMKDLKLYASNKYDKYAQTDDKKKIKGKDEMEEALNAGYLIMIAD
mmetsp:Transcript_21799/g.19325  ORF Transcript_21799/g.19325 Transcript_21799/m.19325 type:complete len:214 (+) Transcript_21799:685-1326(+)